MIVTDIDGTLVGPDSRLNAFTRDTLLACEARGIPVVLASGRTFYGAREIAVQAGLTSPIISANGGRADKDKNGEAIFEDTLDFETSFRVFNHLRSVGCFMTSYVGKNIYMINETNGYGSTCMWRSEATRKSDFIFVDQPERMEREGTNAPYKYEAYSDDVRLMDSLRETFRSWGLSVSSAFPYNLEIMSPGGGKARAIEAIGKRLGIDRTEIMAFGDGSNDISMLEYARYGVAMGNAVPALKEAAWNIAPDQKDDGLAKMIWQYVLSEGNQ